MARWCSIPDLDGMSLDNVADWHDLLVADQEAKAEARRQAEKK